MPVPVYTSSPIHASKASGITPKTADHHEEDESHTQPPPPTTSLGSPTTYPPAQPGARPSLPVQTGIPQPSDASPPPPQPGAVPSPPGRTSHLPPPPKAGETIQQQSPVQTMMPMPPQMSYPPPAPSYPTQGGLATSTTSAGYSPAVPQPTFLEPSTEPDFSHPPGYQQNVHAADFSRDQREAHNASYTQDSFQGYEEEGSIWNTAKKWAAAAGDSLAAAEHEVWKRINKD